MLNTPETARTTCEMGLSELVLWTSVVTVGRVVEVIAIEANQVG